VAPPSNNNQNYLVRLKGQSMLKNGYIVSKSTRKPRHNTCSKYVTLERTAHRRNSVTEKNTNTMFSHLQPARVVRSSPNFARLQSSSWPFKKVYPFFDPTHSFPTGCTEKLGLIDRRAVSQQ